MNLIGIAYTKNRVGSYLILQQKALGSRTARTRVGTQLYLYLTKIEIGPSTREPQLLKIS